MSYVASRANVAAAVTLAILAIAIMTVTSKCQPGPTAEAAAAAHAISDVRAEGFACGAAAMNAPLFPTFPGGSVVRVPTTCTQRRCRKSCGGWDADAACASAKGKPADPSRRGSGCGRC